MGFEDELARGFFGNKSEKSFLSKLFSDKEIDEIRKIIKKERLSREDLIDLLYMLSSSESKKYNLSSKDRYVVLKYYVWIREFVAIIEQIYDYKEDLEKPLEYSQPDGTILKVKNKLDPRCEKIFDNIFRLMEHNVKFLVDLYLNICRTSLSLGGTGFLESLKNKFEMHYNQVGLGNKNAVDNSNSGIITR